MGYRYRKGDEKRVDLVDPAYVESIAGFFLKVGRTYFRTTIQGLKYIPRKGPALIVANHGVLAIESPFLMAEIWKGTRRVVRSLADHFLWSIPLLRDRLIKAGVVDGDRDTAVRLLKSGEMALVYPEGAKGAAKPYDRKYELDWTGRYGFIKVALLANAPIIPVVIVGADDTYWVVNDPYKWARLILRSESMPLPLPIGLGLLPFPAKLSIRIGPPIRLGYGPEAARNERIVEKLQKQVWRTVKDMLERGLAERAGKATAPEPKAAPAARAPSPTSPSAPSRAGTAAPRRRRSPAGSCAHARRRR